LTWAFTSISQKIHALGTMVCYTTAKIISQKGVKVKRKDIPTKTSRYQSYVVRCWQEHSVHAGRETRVWRFSLQNPRTNEQRGFATLEGLLISLQAELADDQVDSEPLAPVAEAEV
jgi:hypothetical protein